VSLFDLLKAETRIRQLEEERLKAVPDFSEDRSAVQSTNPRLAELIKERQETLTREEKAKIVGAWHDYHGA
jgi:hypothetical protein